MYLSSTDIRGLLDSRELVIQGSTAHQFDSSTQIGPCSIDIRIDNEFWRFKDNQRIDILNPYSLFNENSDPDQLCEKTNLEPGDGIDIEPGHIVLARVLEYIELPSFLAGMLIGRSRFSRLGLQVHCTGSFINPGYKGHLPLQIVNNNSGTIRVYPFLSLAQIAFIPVTCEPDVKYQNLDRTIFKDDKGGPSLWYLDRNIQDVAHRLALKELPTAVSIKVQQELQRSRQKTLDQLVKHLESPGFPVSQSPKKVQEYIERRARDFEPIDDRRERKMRTVFFLNTIVLGAALSIFVPSLVSAIQNRDLSNPLLWTGLTLTLFAGFIAWLIFDQKFIGG